MRSPRTRRLWGPSHVDSNGATTREYELEPLLVGPRVHELVLYLKALARKGSKTKLGLKLKHGPTAASLVDYATVIAEAVPDAPPSVLAGTTDTPTNGAVGTYVQPIVLCGQDAGGAGDEWADVELVVVLGFL